MKIETQTLEVERSADFQEVGFSFDATAKAFDILSKQIYTDPILAIIRELSTNASDAHTDARNADHPFDVHLPNTLEPWFTIRDYGTGLSPEDVKTIYTTYFKSTRTTSNDFTGCLGIGSKSPFAYTDQFTIVSNWNGRKYTFSAFKNEQSCPTLAQLGDCNTDEPNGLEIRIAILPGDIRDFITAAQKIYPFFKVTPNITGATLRLDKTVAEIETSEFAIYHSNNVRDFSHKINVVMGQVCYAVDSNKFQHDLGYHGILVLQMPIGSCQVAASREEIHYDEKTIRNVATAIHDAIAAARVELEKRVVNEACTLSKLAKISTYRHLVENLKISGVDGIESSETNKYSLKECTLRGSDRIYMHDLHTTFDGRYNSLDNLLFIENDIDEITPNIKRRLRAYLKSHSAFRHAYLAKIQDNVRFEELFGACHTKLSLLPDVPRASRKTGGDSTRTKPIKIITTTLRRRRIDNEWANIDDLAQVDITDACCVPRDGNWVKWNGLHERPSYVYGIAEILGFKRVYGIAEKRFNATRTKCGLVALDEVAKVKTEAIINGLNQYALSKFVREQTKHIPINFDAKILKGLSTEADDFRHTIEANTDNIITYKSLASRLSIPIPTVVDYTEIFYKKYPLLAAIGHYNTANNADVIQYIKLIEESGGQ